MSNPKLRQKCEAQRKESEGFYKDILTLNDAFEVILKNAQSIKDGKGSSVTPDSMMIIEKAKNTKTPDPHIYRFLDMWEKNMLNVEVI